MAHDAWVSGQLPERMIKMNTSINPKVPILMYHEVLPALLERDQHFMTPLYVITSELFENHIRILAERGYRSLLFEDVPNISADGKYVVITFDDGLAGNYRHALPILKKYGFTATFFVAVGSVSSDRFMNWAELKELVKNGMSIQSHTMSHRPLETLGDEEVLRELEESRQAIEQNLDTKVSALSFPHGSYNRRTVKIAEQAGYRFMCTSNVTRTYRDTFMQNPSVLGRLAVTYKVSAKQLVAWVEYNSAELLAAAWSKRAKNLFKSIIGVKNYSRLYRIFFNIK